MYSSDIYGRFLYATDHCRIIIYRDVTYLQVLTQCPSFPHYLTFAEQSMLPIRCSLKFVYQGVLCLLVVLEFRNLRNWRRSKAHDGLLRRKGCNRLVDRNRNTRRLRLIAVSLRLYFLYAHADTVDKSFNQVLLLECQLRRA